MLRYLAILLTLGFSLNASAYFQEDLLKAKVANVEATQWTLSDWLSEKNKISLMDQWLSLHRSTRWFELALSASYLQYGLTTTGSTVTTHQTGQDFQGDMYLSFLNLYAESLKNNENQTAFAYALGLRLLGSTGQTTGLVARYGVEQWNNQSSLEKTDLPFVEALLQLYVVKNFGLMGQYRDYFAATSNLGNRWSGHKWSAGVFFEALIFRLYADYYQVPIQESGPSGALTFTRSGYEAGLKIFF